MLCICGSFVSSFQHSLFFSRVIMLQYVILVAVILYLQTRLFWVETGTFVIKRRIWAIGLTKYVPLSAGRHYVMPWIEWIVKSKQGIAAELPVGKFRSHEIKEISSETQDSISILSSVSFKYRVCDEKNFLEKIQSQDHVIDNSGSWMRFSSGKYSEWVSVYPLEQKIIDVVKDSWARVSTQDCETQTMILRVTGRMEKETKEFETTMSIEISQFRFSQIRFIIDPLDGNSMEGFVRTYMKGTKAEEYRRIELEHKKESIKALMDVISPIIHEQSHITIQLPKFD